MTESVASCSPVSTPTTSGDPKPDGGEGTALLTNSLMPFAFDRGGAQAGISTVVGFAVAVAPSVG